MKGQPMTKSVCVFLNMLLCIVIAGAAAAAGVGGPAADGESAAIRDTRETTALAPADSGFDNYVYAIGNYNGDLIVGGYFLHAGSVFAIKVAGWNGSEWYALPSIAAGNPVLDFAVFENELYAGYYLPRLNKWNGASWTEIQPYLNSGVSGSIWAVAVYDSALVIGGNWVSDTDQPSYIASWNGASFDSVGAGISGYIRELAVVGGDLIAGGYFTTGDGSVSNRIAAWNGVSWSGFGGGMSDGGVTAITEYNGDLIAAGSFTSAGGTSVSNIARWDGANWQPLGSGLDNYVEALFVHDGKLIAGGWFQNAGGTPANYIASWDGASWSAIGSGLDNRVHALGSYNGYLIAGGRFTTTGDGYVALWDGADWRAVSDVALGIDGAGGTGLPEGFALDQNYPNPFNPSTVIDFTLPHRAEVSIDILNVTGQRVRTLLDRSFAAGTHSVTWDGTDASGRRVASGTYFYRLTVEDRTSARKMLLLK